MNELQVCTLEVLLKQMSLVSLMWILKELDKTQCKHCTAQVVSCNSEQGGYAASYVSSSLIDSSESAESKSTFLYQKW